MIDEITMEHPTRRVIVRRRPGGGSSRNANCVGGTPNTFNFVRSNDGATSLPTKAGRLMRLDRKMKNWFDGHPLLLPYIALMVTLELVVLLVKL